MVQKWIRVLFVAVLLSSCSVLVATPETASLSSLLYTEGDLPEGWTAAEPSTAIPADLPGGTPRGIDRMPEALETGYQGLLKDGEMSGWAAAYKYRNRETYFNGLGRVYIGLGDDRQEIPTFADQATLIPSDPANSDSEYIHFLMIDCNSVVLIRMKNTKDVTPIVQYARNISERVSTAYCGE